METHKLKIMSKIINNNHSWNLTDNGTHECRFCGCEKFGVSNAYTPNGILYRMKKYGEDFLFYKPICAMDNKHLIDIDNFKNFIDVNDIVYENFNDLIDDFITRKMNISWNHISAHPPNDQIIILSDMENSYVGYHSDGEYNIININLNSDYHLLSGFTAMYWRKINH